MAHIHVEITEAHVFFICVHVAFSGASSHVPVAASLVLEEIDSKTSTNADLHVGIKNHSGNGDSGACCRHAHPFRYVATQLANFGNFLQNGDVLDTIVASKFGGVVAIPFLITFRLATRKPSTIVAGPA